MSGTDKLVQDSLKHKAAARLPAMAMQGDGQVLGSWQWLHRVNS